MRLERFLGDAAARTDEYFSLFQDLTAEETKTVEVFRGQGEVSRARRIVSDLVVYQAQLDNASIAEYRDVREVDGAPVPGREDRIQKLLARRAESSSIRDELRRITKESTRYDLDRTVSGLTITEGLPLQAWARALFSFKVAGTERIEGRTAVVVDYQQTVPNARFGFKFSLPSEVGAALYRGRLWIDAETAHLWRERREIAVTAPGAAAPLVIQSTDFHFRASRFGIPLPARIVFTSSLKFDKGPDRLLHVVPVFRVTFEYGPFKRFTATSSDELVAATPEAESPTAAAPQGAADPPADASLGPEFGPDAPESGYTYEELSAQAPPRAAAPVTPEPSATLSRPPAGVAPARPPAPAPRTFAPVPGAASPVPSVPRPEAAEEAGPPASPPAPLALRPAARLPRATQRILEVRTAIPVPTALMSAPPSQSMATLSPPPAPPAPVLQDSAAPPRRAWRPPPS
jgi:hypothetical protein